MKHVLFQVGQEHYALPVHHVQSIEVVPQIRQIPKPPEHVVGVTNLRGVITTVLDMRSIFGAEISSQSAATRILVTDSGAYIVDAAQDVVDIEDDELEPWDGHERVRGVWSASGQLVLVLDAVETSAADEASA